MNIVKRLTALVITGTGTGPRSAQRIIDAQLSYGPIAQ